MPSQRCAFVNATTNIVDNVIIADPDTFHVPGYLVIPSDTASPGDIYDPDTGTFSPPPSP